MQHRCHAPLPSTDKVYSCRPFEWYPGPSIALQPAPSSSSTYAPDLSSVKSSLRRQIQTSSRQGQLQALLTHLTTPADEGCQIRVRDHEDVILDKQVLTLPWLKQLGFDDWSRDGVNELLAKVSKAQRKGCVPHIVFLINSREAQRTMTGVLGWLQLKVIAELGNSIGKLLISLIASCDSLGFSISDEGDMKARIESVLSPTQFNWTTEQLASTATRDICKIEALAHGHGLRPYVALTLNLVLSPQPTAGSSCNSNPATLFPSQLTSPLPSGSHQLPSHNVITESMEMQAPSAPVAPASPPKKGKKQKREAEGDSKDPASNVAKKQKSAKVDH